MVSHPEPTPSWALRASRDLAEWCDARLSTVLSQTHIPPVSNWLASKLVHADDLIASENARSREAGLALFQEIAGILPACRLGEQFLIDHGPIGDPIEPAHLARTHDLTVMPVWPEFAWQLAAQGLVFDSGRPVLLLPQSNSEQTRFDDIIIGWDGSRSASRALAGALPFCRMAQTVRLVAVSGDKAFDPIAALSQAQRHLEYHSVISSIEEIPSAGRNAGDVLLERAKENGASLLVMGGYGHSRVREFVLGGATRTVLNEPGTATLMVH
ncbi:universal stress protein [Sphingobium sp. DEHP117]|uniref:universal stress protein n=1 Tax=Sphingobium sp. DEHP117 TaxID=2993436 RepID=UPI0027D7613E|nr:universal stress protein [Sphingobium sp. DEHP117]MDQ4421623.1 universal stress protein [Sphingobium sp. DEHP117]